VWAAILAWFQVLGGSVFAQAPSSPLEPSRPAAAAARASRSELLVPPLPSQTKPPVEFFRELLAMSIAERNQALTNRTPEDKKLILAKLREYKALKPDQCELRLQATELSWYLLRLMRMPPTNRLAQLEAVPGPIRKPVEDRLEVWDRLPQEARKEFLEKRAAIQGFIELAAGANQPANTNLSPERRAALTNGISKIQAMAEDQRQQLLSRFNQFFELTSQEKERALKTISEPERRQMEKTLRNFGQLTVTQRARCIRSFEKFAGLSIEERNQFLKNAERWKLMTPDQRQAWRNLVRIVPMVMPDMLQNPKPPVPRRVTPPVLTNAN
jgi:hypothetical protein